MTIEIDSLHQETCLSWNDLSSYAFYQLNPEERLVVDNHLSACDLCRKAMDGVQLLLQERSFSKEALVQWFEGQQSMFDQPWASQEPEKSTTEA